MNILEHIYYAGYRIKKRRMLAVQKRLPYPVVSIGNLTLGGTGKTPSTIELAKQAVLRGYQPVILTRGYKGRAKGPCFVAKSRSEDVTDKYCNAVSDAGDEPVLIAAKVPEACVVKSADRYEGGMFFIQNHDMASAARTPIFILDDGFQHWKLYRDIDVVLVDGRRGFGNRKMLPLGTMRGPLSELADADFFIITKSGNPEIEAELHSLNPAAPVYGAEYAIDGVLNKNGYKLNPDELKRTSVLAFCGLADPESFRRSILSVCPNLASFISFSDHRAYTQKDVENICKEAASSGCEVIITTEKDMVKLLELDIPDYIFSLSISFSVSSDYYEKIFNSLKREQG